MPYHPHPHIIICTSFISSIDYNVFIILQCHLKDLLYRNVNQLLATLSLVFSSSSRTVSNSLSDCDVRQLDAKCSQNHSKASGACGNYYVDIQWTFSKNLTNVSQIVPKLRQIVRQILPNCSPVLGFLQTWKSQDPRIFAGILNFSKTLGEHGQHLAKEEKVWWKFWKCLVKNLPFTNVVK